VHPAARALVVVVGSINLDLVVHANVRPQPGETVLGTAYEEVVGGKGLNQALAAARVGPAALVGAVGSDETGASVLRVLRDRGVDLSGVQVLAGSTGRAIITVTPDGENDIVVVPLANGCLRPAGVRAALDALGGTVVLAQREVPAEVVALAAAWAVEHGARFVLNPSPVEGVPNELLRHADPVIVNVHEARAILGRTGDKGGDLAVGMLGTARTAVVTAGGDGCWVATSASIEHVPARRLKSVGDTTGAGDEFAGSLAAHLADGASLSDAAHHATTAAAHAVSTERSRRSLPVDHSSSSPPRRSARTSDVAETDGHSPGRPSAG